MNEQKKEIKNDEAEKQQTENTELSDETLEEVNGQGLPGHAEVRHQSGILQGLRKMKRPHPQGILR